MAVSIQETPNEIEFKIQGSLTGIDALCIQQFCKGSELRECWRQIVVDISELRHCDHAGEQILSNLLAHGCHFSARNPHSLELLRRISNHSADPGIALPACKQDAAGEKPATLSAVA